MHIDNKTSGHLLWNWTAIITKKQHFPHRCKIFWYYTLHSRWQQIGIFCTDAAIALYNSSQWTKIKNRWFNCYPKEKNYFGTSCFFIQKAGLNLPNAGDYSFTNSCMQETWSNPPNNIICQNKVQTQILKEALTCSFTCCLIYVHMHTHKSH